MKAKTSSPEYYNFSLCVSLPVVCVPTVSLCSFFSSPLIHYRQHCVSGNDGRGLLLGRLGRQVGQTAVSAPLYVHKWLLRLPIIFCAGLWRLLALSHDSRLRVSPFPASSTLN